MAFQLDFRSALLSSGARVRTWTPSCYSSACPACSSLVQWGWALAGGGPCSPDCAAMPGF